MKNVMTRSGNDPLGSGPVDVSTPTRVNRRQFTKDREPSGRRTDGTSAKASTPEGVDNQKPRLQGEDPALRRADGIGSEERHLAALLRLRSLSTPRVSDGLISVGPGRKVFRIFSEGDCVRSLRRYRRQKIRRAAGSGRRRCQPRRTRI